LLNVANAFDPVENHEAEDRSNGEVGTHNQ
jgi:hypothetical protein